MDFFDHQASHALHFQDLFAIDQARMMDAAQKNSQVFELPLWNGLRVQAIAVQARSRQRPSPRSHQNKPTQHAKLHLSSEPKRLDISETLQARGTDEKKQIGKQQKALVSDQRQQPHRQPLIDNALPSGLKEAEIEWIARTLRQMKGNVAQTAKVLGISRATIYRKLKP